MVKQTRSFNVLIIVTNETQKDVWKKKDCKQGRQLIKQLYHK